VKIGPWREHEWSEFINLDTELQPKPTSDPAKLNWLFASPEPSVPSAQAVADALNVRREHPVYRVLEKDSNFQQAWAVFNKLQKKARTGRLASPTVPLRFLREFVLHAGLAHWGARHGAKRLARWDRRRSAAAKNARRLASLLSTSIRLRDFVDHAEELPVQPFDDVTVWGLLRLAEELEADVAKPRGEKREPLKRFAHQMFVRCGLSSPSVLLRFADMVGIDCDHRTASRYTRAARERDKRRSRIAIARALAERQ
jgi:hypothetical protein